MASVTHPEDGFVRLSDTNNDINVLTIDEFAINRELINVYDVSGLAGLVRELCLPEIVQTGHDGVPAVPHFSGDVELFELGVCDLFWHRPHPPPSPEEREPEGIYILEF